MKFLFVVSFLCLGQSVFAQKQKLIDSLINLASTSNNDVKMKLYGDISWEMKELNTTEALVYANKEIDLATTLNNKKYIAQGYNDRGGIYFLMGKQAEAMKDYELALEIRKTLNDKSGIASVLSKMGVIYRNKGDLAGALKIQLQTLKIFEDTKDTLRQIATLIFLGELNRKVLNFKEADKVFERTFALLKLKPNAKQYSNALTTYGTSLSDQKRFDEALAALMQANQQQEKLENYIDQASTLNNIGNVYSSKNQFADALIYFQQAYDLAVKTNNVTGQPVYLANLGSMKIKLNNFVGAEKDLLAAKKLSESTNQKEKLSNTYGFLNNLYDTMQNKDLALEYANLKNNIKDSIFSDEMAQQFADMQTKYETEKKESQIIAQQLELRKKQIWIFGILGLLALSVLYGLLYFNKYKHKRKSELANIKLQQQEEKTHAIIAAEEKERLRVARELHDGVGQLMAASRLSLGNLESDEDLNKNQKASINNSVKMVDDAIKELRTVSHNMMPNALIRNGLVQAMRDFVDQLNQQSSLKISFETAGLDKPLPSNKEAVLYRILQEIMQNIIKHAKATEVHISYTGDGQEATLMVEDNGVGFDTKNTKAFDGIGLKNIVARAEFIKAKVYWDSSLGNGTTVTVELDSN
jgi:two-component system, NarL family, sensor kinase